MIRVCSSGRDDMGKMAKKINASGRNTKTKQKNKTKKQTTTKVVNFQFTDFPAMYDHACTP